MKLNSSGQAVPWVPQLQKPLPSANATIDYEYASLPGLIGVACQDRLAAHQAFEFAQSNGLSHFYVDSSQGACDTALVDALAQLLAVAPQLPIFHGNYRQPIASPDPVLRLTARAGILREIVAASHLKAPLIVHGTSSLDLHGAIPTHELALAAFDHELFELEDCARRLHVPLWLENLPANEAAVFNCLNDYEEILARHPSVSVIFDVGHANIDNDSPFEALRRFPGRIAALSLSDNDGKVDLHKPLGQGCVGFDKLLDVIDATKWRGLYVFETIGSALEDDLALLRLSLGPRNSTRELPI